VILLSHLLRTKVMSRETAEELGDVRGVVVDVATQTATALQVGRGRKARLADWPALTGVGPDAVVVASEDVLRPPRDEREEQTVGGDTALMKALVLTDRGDAMGNVADVELDEATGRLVSLTVDDVLVDATRLLAVGRYAVVVHDD
jgi:sporulation protein YlmC with PRC-barrel domain